MAAAFRTRCRRDPHRDGVPVGGRTGRSDQERLSLGLRSEILAVAVGAKRVVAAAVCRRGFGAGAAGAGAAPTDATRARVMLSDAGCSVSPAHVAGDHSPT